MGLGRCSGPGSGPSRARGIYRDIVPPTGADRFREGPGRRSGTLGAGGGRVAVGFAGGGAVGFPIRFGGVSYTIRILMYRDVS